VAAPALAEYEWRADRREFSATLVVLLGPISRPTDLDDKTIQESVHIDSPCSRDTRARYPHTYGRGLTGQRRVQQQKSTSSYWLTLVCRLVRKRELNKLMVVIFRAEHWTSNQWRRFHCPCHASVAAPVVLPLESSYMSRQPVPCKTQDLH
jgi:hypothetical protein